MQCPVCKETALVMTERQGIEIDYCPQCRGVWLDRGELDKIIERSAAPTSPPPQQPSQNYSQGHQSHYDKRHKPYKRKSLLGELFDF